MSRLLLYTLGICTTDIYCLSCRESVTQMSEKMHETHPAWSKEQLIYSGYTAIVCVSGLSLLTVHLLNVSNSCPLIATGLISTFALGYYLHHYTSYQFTGTLLYCPIAAVCLASIIMSLHAAC